MKLLATALLWLLCLPVWAYGPIYTASMPGRTFEQRLSNAYELAGTWRGERKVVWETGWQSITDTIDRPSIDGLQDCATFTVLHWDDSVPDEYRKPMIRMRASNRSRMDGIYFRGRRLNTQEDIIGDAAVELIPDYEHNKNTARNITLEQCRFDNFERGSAIGGFSSPDITGVTYRDCSFGDCVIGLEACGGNVIIKIDHSDFVGRKMQYGLHTIYSGNRYFDGSEPQYVDLWGNARTWNWCDSPRWRERLLDSARRNGLHPEFDPTTAQSPGGGPDINCTDSNFSFGPNAELEDRYAAWSEGNAFELVRTRVEGNAGAAKITKIHGNPNMHDKRFDCLLEDVHVVSRVKPIKVEKLGHNSGFALRIVRGYYANPDLPEQSSDPKKGIVVWDKPRGPEGVIE